MGAGKELVPVAETVQVPEAQAQMIPAILLLLMGDVVYTNLQPASGSGSRTFASPTTFWAQQINIQNAFKGITNTQVNLWRGSSYTGTDTFNVFLAQDIQGIPGSIIGTLGGGNWRDLATNSAGTWNQSGTLNFSDQQAGNYWLMVQTVGNNSLLRWSYGANTNAGQTAFFNSTNQFWSYPNANNSLGATMSTVAVPEPGNFVMGVIAAVAGCLFWFFRLS